MIWLCARSPLALGKHGLGLDAGAGIHQVVAEEDLRRCSAGGSVLGHIVSTDVDCGSGGFLDELDGSSLAVSAADAVGLAFGSLDDQARNAASTEKKARQSLFVGNLEGVYIC